jgi:hypothetical protein
MLETTPAACRSLADDAARAAQIMTGKGLISPNLQPSTPKSKHVKRSARFRPDRLPGSGQSGVGYLAATLERRSALRKCWIFGTARKSITARLLPEPPLVVGFSLIFQCFLPQHRQGAELLRKAGICSHSTTVTIRACVTARRCGTSRSSTASCAAVGSTGGMWERIGAGHKG